MGKDYTYKGTGRDKAVNKLREILDKHGGKHLDSSGFGDRLKVEGKSKKEIEKLLAKKLKERDKKKTKKRTKTT